MRIIILAANEPSAPPDTDIRHVDRDQAARELLDLFYPVHYAVGMKVEDTLRSSDILDRHQVAILWIIRTVGTDGVSIRRKILESVMTSWYDISSSAISKAIRAIAKPPLSYLSIEEHPNSAREKLVKLTPAGQEFVQTMVVNGTAMCSWYLGEMSQWDGEVDTCIYIFSKVNAIFDRMIDESKLGGAELIEGGNYFESVLRHPLASSFVDTKYSWSDIPRVPREYASLMQLDIFFPIHYKAGNALETALRSSVKLSRQQVIILWIIAAEGADGKFMPRKSIETALSDWLEITSSSISKAIRSLCAPPLSLLYLKEHPQSGREKMVCLNPKGERFIKRMFDNGTQFLEGVIANLGDDEIDMLIHIFSRTSDIFEYYPGPFRSTPPAK